ncbi:hypothetical protein PPYR_06622 [Photinus pyralis]|uniref:DUF4774 domain-containing protein n=1 Tax=Photinus pyralis TaxID=7054 RepID=A0A5N4AN08_PHOPY|nr:stress response protein NST1-like isoform X2 [Photinus pyralis]KAB0798742.1 hypothetical protein PPYR_06622 [Photinus pyralis]
MLLILMLLVPLAHSKPQGSPSQIHEENVQSLESPKITFLPYYGGAKGNSLQIIEMPNGTVTMEIVATPHENLTVTEGSPSEVEMPQLPQRPSSEFASNLKNIHKAALNIIKLQEAAKRQGEVNNEDQAEYRENIESLQLSAEKLTHIHDNEDDLDLTATSDLVQWLGRRKTTKKDKDKTKEEQKKKKEEEEKRKEEEEEKNRKEEEEEVKRKEEEKEEESGEGNNENVVVSLPPEDASVAEAKPVGLAVAGTGGVAASKPVATAIVGPGGLAVAQPVGTAIAGVSPDQALVPIYAENEDTPKKDHKKEEKKKISNTEYLNRIIQKYHKV